MPTTTAGTVYTVTSFTSSAGEACRRAVADAHALDAHVPLIIFCHGNPGTDQTSADFQFGAGYTALRERLLDDGYAYVEGHGAGAGWGNTAQRTAYRAMYDAAKLAWDVGWVAVIGRSMGGLIGAYLASRDPVIAPRCKGFVSLSGTANLSDRYSTAGSTDQANLLAAYGATDDASLRVAVADFDPMLFQLTDWTGRNAIIQYDTSDTTVPPNINGIAWRTKYGPQLATNSVFSTSGGDHNTTPNDATQNNATATFLESVLAAPFTAPSTGINLVDLYAVAADLTLTPLTLS